MTEFFPLKIPSISGLSLNFIVRPMYLYYKYYMCTHLCHFLSVGFGVQRCFGQQHGVFFRGYSEFVVERVVPHFFHIVPVGNDTMFNWIFDGQHTSFRLRFIANVAVLLAHAHHDTLRKKKKILQRSECTCLE